MKKIIVGIGGSGGISLAVRLLKEMKKTKDVESLLIYTKEAELKAEEECGMSIEEIRKLADVCCDEYDRNVESGGPEFAADGMIVVPCSVETVNGIAQGTSENLLLQAAGMMVRKKKPLVLAEVETSQSQEHWGNMASLVRKQNVVIMPWMMTFYNGPKAVEYIEQRMAGKICGCFDVKI